MRAIGERDDTAGLSQGIVASYRKYFGGFMHSVMERIVNKQ